MTRDPVLRRMLIGIIVLLALAGIGALVLMVLWIGASS